MATKQERDLILEMLAAGRIDARQARLLFDAVERFSEDEQAISADAFVSDFTHELRHTVERDFRHADRAVREAVWDF